MLNTAGPSRVWQGREGDEGRNREARVENWVLDVVRGMGPGGVALLMFLENLFPPLPSEVIMPLAGYLSARGEAPFWAMVGAGTAGSVAGAGFWYAVGRAVTHERLAAWVGAHGTWMAMTPADVDGAAAWFGRHGFRSVLLGRMVPVVRTMISVPAGFTRMPLGTFLALSTIGSAVWTLGLAWAGRLLGSRFSQVEQWIGPVSSAIVVGAALWYVYRVLRIRRDKRALG